MKLKTTTKWLLMATIVVVLSAGILVAIPMYANRSQPTTRSLPECPPGKLGIDEVVLFVNPDDCSTYFKCDHGVMREFRCPEGLAFCAEKDTCSWRWDPECRFNCR